MIRDEVAQAIAQIPKPRGEGAWAWIRYYLLIARNWAGQPGTCREDGCPLPLQSPMHTRCQRHTADHRTREDLLMRERYDAYSKQLAEVGDL